MRYSELRLENLLHTVAEIKQNCSIILQKYIESNFYMTRGSTLKDDIYKITSGEQRQPKDMAPNLHNAFVKAQEEAGIKARRDNSTFATVRYLNRVRAAPYLFVVFPTNDCYFSYVKHVDDLFTMAFEFVEYEHDKDHNALGFKVKPGYINSTVHGKISEFDLNYFRYSIADEEVLINGTCYMIRGHQFLYILKEFSK